VAIAISLANDPNLLLADEPTGSVDSKTADVILGVFRELNRSLQKTIVIVSHDTELTKKLDRVVAIRDGKTSSEILRKSFYEAEEHLLNEKDMKAEETHIELAVIDRAGRIQIPRDYLDSIELGDANKLRVELEDGKIMLVNPKNS
jgi:ABC-type glutathione transport system ATPase component